MKTSFHRIYTKDGLELHGLLYEPDKKTKTVVAHVHGMGGNFYENGFLDNLSKILTKNNIAFCPFNNRGHGHIITFVKKTGRKISYEQIGNVYEKFEDCVLDIKAHIDFLEKQGFANIHLCSHSLGPSKASYYLHKTKDKRIKSLIFLSPSDMLGLLRIEKRFEQDIKTAKEMIEQNNGDKLMPRDIWDEYPISAKSYLSIFGDDSKAAIFNFYNPEFGFKVLNQIKVPVFATMGRKDDCLTISIKDTMETIKRECKSSPRCETKILGNADHCYRGYENQLANVVLKWLKSF